MSFTPRFTPLFRLHNISGKRTAGGKVAAACRESDAFYNQNSREFLNCSITLPALAVFSLSLMGTNIEDYIRETHRTLKADGLLKIAEPASRWLDQKRRSLLDMIQQAGFNLIGEVRESYKFMYVDAAKV